MIEIQNDKGEFIILLIEYYKKEIKSLLFEIYKGKVNDRFLYYLIIDKISINKC